MAHYLTFDSSVTCTVNGVSVTSGYELHDGDVIRALSYFTGGGFLVNSEAYINGSTVDIYDTDIIVNFDHGN